MKSRSSSSQIQGLQTDGRTKSSGDQPYYVGKRVSDYLRVRGVSEKVWEARPYREFRDKETTRDHFPQDLAPNQEADLSKMTNWMAGGNPKKTRNPDPGGFIIARVPPPEYPPITPELKSWADFPGRTTVHYHGEPTTKPLYNPKTGKQLHPRQILTPEQARFHIDGKKHGGDGTPGSGTNSQEVHVHVEWAKYRFLASPRRPATYPHTHERMHAKDDPQELENHLLKKHAGELAPLPDEKHEHRYSRKDKSVRVAARFDLHPFALPLIEKAEHVFLVIEGCIKSDAILSACLRAATPVAARGAVFSVPAVTQWDEIELERFAREYLGNKKIIIVPDADWIEKPDVLTQAMLCRSFLRRLGFLAHVSAPPLWGLGRGLKAVDDWLGARFSLADLAVLDRRLPSGNAAWVYVRDHSEGRSEASIRRNSRVLECLALHAGIRENKYRGLAFFSVPTLSRVLGIGRTAVSRAMSDLEKIEAVRVDGKLDVSEGHWRSPDYYYRWLDWDEQPKIWIRDPTLFVENLGLGRLADVLADPQAWEGQGERERGYGDPAKWAPLIRQSTPELTVEEIADMAGVSRDRVKKALAATPPKGDPHVSVPSGPIELHHNYALIGPAGFSFDAKPGRRLALTFTNPLSCQMKFSVEGPPSRPNRQVCEEWIEPESGILIVIEPRNRGKHTARIGLEPGYTNVTPVTAEIRELVSCATGAGVQHMKDAAVA